MTAVLLWRIWRGATWSRWVLTALSYVSAALAGVIVFGISLGAQGMNTQGLPTYCLYAAVGGLLCTPSVRCLARSAHR